MIVKKVSEDLRSHEVRELWLEYWQHYSKNTTNIALKLIV